MGWLLAVNGVGGVMGAELVRALVLPEAGVHVAMGIVGMGYAAAALLVGIWTKGPRFPAYGVPAAGVGVAAVITVSRLTELPLFYWSQAYDVIEVKSSREGVLTVFEREGFGRGLSFNNQYLLGGSGAADDERRQSHIPLLLHPAPKKVCYAGLGTGITASGALRHTAVQSITAIEISQLVVEAAAEQFTRFNGEIFEQPRVEIHVEDARTYVAACSERFDVIIGDVFTPWRPGEAGLASLEYFQDAREALRPGGVFCQWFPLHQLTAYEFGLIQATFRTVFPKAYLFRNHLKTGNIILGMVGFRNAELDWEVVENRCESEREAGELRDPLCRHVEGMAMLYFGMLNGTPPGGTTQHPGQYAGRTGCRIQPGGHAARDPFLLRRGR